MLHLWQVPDFVEVWGPKSQVWLYKMGTPNPPRSFFGGSDYIDFTKSGNVEQELPLQNGFLYISGFSGETKWIACKGVQGQVPDFVVGAF